MLIVDTNVIAYLYLPTEQTKYAEALLKRDPHWAAPILWRGELRNILTLYLRKKVIDFDTALEIQNQAEDLLKDGEYEVTSTSALTLINASSCSAYDCEFVALARALDKQLVTVDKKLIRAFPENCVSLKDAVS
ncbi:MAG: type II toxin-antitoxin system VapC family toxin [Pseudomonadales bacterium]|nr:type II toxin-antitoxin system VapC family toxin [Pseudomonadales bacterium]